MFFMFKSNSLCKPEKLVGFFSDIDRTRRELVELMYITITPGKFESVFFHVQTKQSL